MTSHMDSGITESGWTGHVQWGPILAGALAGFAATLILATLGTAMGVTIGASAVDAGPAGMEKTAIGIGIGAAAWMLICAVVVGIVGGMVLKRTARLDRSYLPVAFGTLTWAAGVFLALLVASPGMTGAAGVLAGGAAGVGAALPAQIDRAPGAVLERLDPSPASKSRPELTAAERATLQEAAEKTAKAAATLAWVVLGTQLLSLAATLMAARCQKATQTTVRIGTQPA